MTQVFRLTMTIPSAGIGGLQVLRLKCSQLVLSCLASYYAQVGGK